MPVGFPIVFIAIRGGDENEPDTPCFHNPTEADYVANQLIPSLLESCPVLQQEMDIGVISPYRSQVVRIRKLLRNRRLGSLRAGTVEDYQGQEQRVIVVSCTRASPKWLNWDVEHQMGLLQPKRMNVAITRAQALLLIVGDPALLQFNAHWRSLMQYCWRKNAVIGSLPTSVCCSGPILDTPFIPDAPQ